MANNGGNNQSLQTLIQKEPYRHFVKPDSIRALKSVGDDRKQDLITGSTNLWKVISSHLPEDTRHKVAIEKLQALTKALSDQERKWLQAQGAQQPSQQPRQQPQQQPQQSQQPQFGNNRPTSQGPAGPNAERSASNVLEVPESFRQAAENIQWVSPANVPAEPNYREELKKRYAEALYKHELHGKHAIRLEQQAEQLRAQNRDIPENLNQQRQGHLTKQRESKAFLERVHQQQNQLKEQLQQQQSQQAARNANGGLGNASGTQQQQPMNQPNSQANMNPRPLPQNTSSDIRQQQVNRPPTSGSHAHAPPSASSGQGNVPATPQFPQQQATFNTPRQPHPGGPGSFANSPQTSMPPSSAQPGGPVPYSHQGAIDAAAKSYSNNAPPQQPGVPGQYNGGSSYNRPDVDKNNQRNKNWSISKDFKPAAPQPVQMAPSRPTLAGANSGPMGSMGQPAIQQQPSYNLHGPGDRVLDKKKLDELVLQVCGGDGSGAQGLHPEVEESILQLADEFFDNVVSSACKLAKLRGSNQLEIRDIQLVLQKTYNIRIPGYSTDEVRTVRKVQPTPAYLQKMNAVQAAKMTKTDI